VSKAAEGRAWCSRLNEFLTKPCTIVGFALLYSNLLAFPHLSRCERISLEMILIIREVNVGTHATKLRGTHYHRGRRRRGLYWYIEGPSRRTTAPWTVAASAINNASDDERGSAATAAAFYIPAATRDYVETESSIAAIFPLFLRPYVYQRRLPRTVVLNHISFTCSRKGNLNEQYAVRRALYII